MTDLIGELIKKANGRIAIMPGSGVNEDTVDQIIRNPEQKKFIVQQRHSRKSEMVSEIQRLPVWDLKKEQSLN